MPILRVEILEGRSEEKKAELIEQLTLTVSRVLDAPAQNVRVILYEVPKGHWGIGGVPVSRLPGR